MSVRGGWRGGSWRAGATAAGSAPGPSGPPGSPAPCGRRVASCLSGAPRSALLAAAAALSRPLNRGAAVRRLHPATRHPLLAPRLRRGRRLLGSCSSRRRPCGERRPRANYSSHDALRGVVGRGGGWPKRGAEGYGRCRAR